MLHAFFENAQLLFFGEMCCRFTVKMSRQHLASVTEAKDWRDNDETGNGFSWAANGQHSISPRQCESPQPLFDQAALVPSDMKLRGRSRSQRSGGQRCPAMLAPRLPAAETPHSAPNQMGNKPQRAIGFTDAIFLHQRHFPFRRNWRTFRMILRSFLCKECHSYQISVLHTEHLRQHTKL